MPSGVVKTKRDEEKWDKAKEIAKDQGQGENYAYIMGIYKKMKPDHFKKAVDDLAIRYLLADDVLEHEGKTARFRFKANGRIARLGPFWQKPYETYLSDLDQAVKDPKVRALLTSEGKDNKFTLSAKSIAVKKLKPTQSEIDVTKSLGYNLKSWSDYEKCLKGNSVLLTTPVLTFKGRFILDGHHRWSQVFAVNQDATIACLDLDIDGIGPLDALKAVQTAIAIVNGSVISRPAKGTNLLHASQGEVQRYIEQNLSPEVLEKSGLTERDFILNMWNNIEAMKKWGQPVPGAPSRGSMPQTDKAPGAVKLLTQGKINLSASRKRLAAVPEKYKHIDFTPPESVANAAAKGLEYRQKASPSNRGGLTPEEASQEGIGSGVQRATNLKNRDTISPEVIRQMVGFFSRHEKNKSIAPEHKNEPWNDKGYVSWLLWGGDPGKTWSAKIMKQMDEADKKGKTANEWLQKRKQLTALLTGPSTFPRGVDVVAKDRMGTIQVTLPGKAPLVIETSVAESPKGWLFELYARPGKSEEHPLVLKPKVVGSIVAQFALRYAQDAVPETQEDVTEFLRREVGPTQKVNKTWIVEPFNRTPMENVPPEYENEWYHDYADPWRSKALAKLDRQYGRNSFAVTVDQKGYLVVTSLKNKTAATETLTPEVIQKLRKDFLMLTKNVPRVTRANVDEFRRGVNTWGQYLYDLFAQIRPEIKSRLRDPKLQVEKGWANHYLEKQDDLWDFIYQLRNVPEPEPVQEPFTHYKPDDEWGRDYLIRRTNENNARNWENFQEKLRKWDTRVKAYARKTWKWLEEFAKWAANAGFWGGGGEAVVWDDQRKEIHDMAGFRIVVRGYDPRSSFHRDLMGGLQASLRFYRERAQKVLPWLIQNQLPMFALFSGSNKGDAAATYEYNRIDLTPWAMSGVGSTVSQARENAKIYAHEMGHHLFRRGLSQESQKFWTVAISGDYGNLDLREVLKKMRPNESSTAFEQRLDREDPILSLQLATLYHNPTYHTLDLFSATAIRDALASGRVGPIVKVPKVPVTGYGAKNPEEAFCEAIGLLVAYGPRAVHPKIVSWLMRIVPSVKLASSDVKRARALADDVIKYLTAAPKFTKGNVLSALKKAPWRPDANGWESRIATFYSVNIIEQRNPGTGDSNFKVVWYTGKPGAYRDSQMVPGLMDAIALANRVKPASDAAASAEDGADIRNILASQRKSAAVLNNMLELPPLGTQIMRYEPDIRTPEGRAQAEDEGGCHIFFEDGSFIFIHVYED